MMGSAAGPRLQPTCTFERPAAADLKCDVDSACVPLPSQAHTHTCVNKASPAAAFARPEIITTLFDSAAAYRPDDCACFRGVCVDKKDTAVAAAVAASAVWAARPEAQGYEAHVAVSCFCPQQDFTITVAGGDVVGAWDNVANKRLELSALPSRAKGIDLTFAEIARVLASSTVMGGIQMQVTAKYAPEGYPESAAFWPDQTRSGGVADVDWSVRYSAVRAAPAYPAACLLPQEVGMCRGVFPKWGFSAADGRCTLFTYGGCGGNLNRFDDEAACSAACGSVGEGAVSAADGGNAPRLPVAGVVLGAVAALLLAGAAVATAYIFLVKRRAPRTTFADGDYVTFAAGPHKQQPPAIAADEAKPVN